LTKENSGDFFYSGDFNGCTVKNDSAF